METIDIHVRIPPEVVGALKARAEQDARSLNSEIIVALREWLERSSKTRR